MDKQELGIIGEGIAQRHLISKGYTLIDKNWRYRNKEIDLIMKDGDEIVIVEVKTRAREDFESPRDLIKKKKQRFLIEAADAYLFKNSHDGETRFDVVIIYFENNKPIINHIEEAFQPNLLL